MAHHRSFRDRYSATTPSALGLKVQSECFLIRALPFSTCSIAIYCNVAARKDREQTYAGLTVGVSPIVKNYCVSEGEDGSWHNRYMENLSAFLSWLIQKGHRIAFRPRMGMTPPAYRRFLKG